VLNTALRPSRAALRLMESRNLGKRLRGLLPRRRPGGKR